METITIGEEKATLLSNAIAQIVSTYSKSKNIDAIYINSFNNKNDTDKCAKLIYKEIVNPTINMVLVFNDSAYENDLYNLKRAKKLILEKTGVSLIVDGWASWNYTFFMIHYRECRACNDLVNGHILFDRNNRYTELQERLLLDSRDNYTLFSYTNATAFEPPLQLIKK